MVVVVTFFLTANLCFVKIIIYFHTMIDAGCFVLPQYFYNKAQAFLEATLCVYYSEF